VKKLFLHSTAEVKKIPPRTIVAAKCAAAPGPNAANRFAPSSALILYRKPMNIRNLRTA